MKMIYQNYSKFWALHQSNWNTTLMLALLPFSMKQSILFLSDLKDCLDLPQLWTRMQGLWYQMQVLK